MYECVGCRWPLPAKGGDRPRYCNSCALAAVELRKAFAAKYGTFKKGEACVGCGKPATGRDHRDYSRLDLWEYVCHSCNSRRGPAKFPPYMRAASRTINKLLEEHWKMKAKLEKLKAQLKELKP